MRRKPLDRAQASPRRRAARGRAICRAHRQVIDGLEMLQAPSPQPALEEQIARLRFVRARLLEQAAIALAAQAMAGAR